MPPRRRSSTRGGGRMGRKKPNKFGAPNQEGFIPIVYFNETYVVSYADPTNKRSKPRGEQVHFMETFKNASIASVPPLASAEVNPGLKSQISMFATAKQEAVTIFVAKAREEASQVFLDMRFKKVHDLLTSETTRDGFLNFLKTEHCDELLMLSEKIDATLKMKRTSEIETSNKDIFETFIVENAPMEVNLDPKMQARLEEEYNDPEKRKQKTLFLPAKKELFRHLDFEFNRFKTKSEYTDLEMMEREKDVEKWKNNFNDVIHDNIGRRVLLNFMMLERNEENLLFFMAVQKMKQCNLIEEIKEQNQMIFDTFIGPEADDAIPEEFGSADHPQMNVNIDYKVRSDIEENLKSTPASKTIYDKAQTAILHSIMDESWPRFKDSAMLDSYKDKAASIKSKPKSKSSKSEESSSKKAKSKSKNKSRSSFTGIFKKK